MAGYIYRDSRTEKWIMAFRDTDGRLRRIKTDAPTKELAKMVLASKNVELTKAKIAGTDAVTPISFRDFSAKYLRYSRKNKAHSTSRRDRSLINNLLSAFGTQRLSEIKARQVEEYKIKRASQVAPATVNRELACLKNMFNKAIQWDYAKENPVRKVKLFREDNTIVRFLSSSERQRLLAFSPGYLRPLIITALNTGLRKGELLNLKWSQIDLENRIISVENTKSLSEYQPDETMGR